MSVVSESVKNYDKFDEKVQENKKWGVRTYEHPIG